MRAFVILAILGLAVASEEERVGGLCRGIEDSEINRVFATARVGATAILGESCPSFNIDAVAFDGECRALVRQATCYGIRAAKLYDVEVVDYGLLRSDVRNMERLGNLACEKTQACFRQVRDAMEVCIKTNKNFIDETIAAAEKAYRDNLETRVAEFAETNRGSILGDLVNMAMDQFSSAEDIQSFIEDHLTESAAADARAAADEVQTLAQGWCDSGCTSRTARFLRGIFGHMNGGQCTDASVFCGDCQTRATSYFTRNQLPCCVEDVVQRGIQAYEYVVENYEETLYRYAEAIRERMTETSIAEAMEIKDRLVREFGCVSEVYSNNRPQCL